MKRVSRSRLVAAARAAMQNAHAPYSGFRVGAALLARSGHVFVGCNVENASYPVSLCAERAALAAAVAAGCREFEVLVIVTTSQFPCPPCGMCRQALAEFGGDLLVALVGSDGGCTEFRLQDLLPEAFTPAFLVEPRPRGGEP